jgi:hypothetical protein
MHQTQNTKQTSPIIFFDLVETPKSSTEKKMQIRFYEI